MINSSYFAASYRKFMANNALKQSSVNLVQYFIKFDKFVIEAIARKRDVQMPVQL